MRHQNIISPRNVCEQKRKKTKKEEAFQSPNKQCRHCSFTKDSDRNILSAISINRKGTDFTSGCPKIEEEGGKITEGKKKKTSGYGEEDGSSPVGVLARKFLFSQAKIGKWDERRTEFIDPLGVKEERGGMRKGGGFGGKKNSN